MKMSGYDVNSYDVLIYCVRMLSGDVREQQKMSFLIGAILPMMHVSSLRDDVARGVRPHRWRWEFVHKALHVTF